jgi:hypothetical protein
VSWEFLTAAWTLAVVPSAIAIEIGPALWDGLFGNASEAKKRALVAANLSKDRDVEYGAAFALILAGESERITNAGERFGRRFPEDSAVQSLYLPRAGSKFSYLMVCMDN